MQCSVWMKAILESSRLVEKFYALGTPNSMASGSSPACNRMKAILESVGLGRLVEKFNAEKVN